MHLRFLTFLSFLIILFAARCAWAQIAPAAVAVTQGGPGEHYLFRSQGASAPGGFLYVNYGTGELDAILVTVAPNGNFSGTSPATGRLVSGQVLSSTVNFTYNGVSLSAPKSSPYGPTRALAGAWSGTVADPNTGTGFGAAIVTSQGQVITLAAQDFLHNAGFGMERSIPAETFQSRLLTEQQLAGFLHPPGGHF